MAKDGTKLGMGLMMAGLFWIIIFITLGRFFLSAAGLALYIVGFSVYCWQGAVRCRKVRDRIRTEIQQDQFAIAPGNLRGYTASLREKGRKRQLRQLKFLGLLAVLLFPFYDKLIEMLMEALVFGHGNVRLILGIMTIAFSVAFIVGSGGVVIQDLLERKAGRDNYLDMMNALEELDMGKVVPVGEKDGAKSN